MQWGNHANFSFKCKNLQEFRNFALEGIRAVLEIGLEQTFEEVSVKCVPCPDLTQEPFNLAAPGLCGQTALIQVGHRSNLNQDQIPNKIYDIKNIVKCVHPDCDNSFIFGSGVTSLDTRHLKELVTNMNLVSKKENNFDDRIITRQNSRIITVNKYENKCYLRMLTKSESTCSTSGTYFISEGSVGKVLKVHAKRYRSDVIPSIKEFIISMHNAFKKYHGDKELVALSGVYVPCIHWKHEVGLHPWELPSLYPKNPYETDAFRFCDVEPCNALITTFTSSATQQFECPGFGPISFECDYVRSLSHHNAGEYIAENNHDVEFLGYFCLAEKLYFVD